MTRDGQLSSSRRLRHCGANRFADLSRHTRVLRQSPGPPDDGAGALLVARLQRDIPLLFSTNCFTVQRPMPQRSEHRRGDRLHASLVAAIALDAPISLFSLKTTVTGQLSLLASVKSRALNQRGKRLRSQPPNRRKPARASVCAGHALADP